ncbi:hypothetical protein MTO96_034528 [Rhipicephalus appendiculatus]
MKAATFAVLLVATILFSDAAPVTVDMDVESPGRPPIPSTPSVATPRKRSGHPSDADSEDTLIYATVGDESSDESDSVPVTMA